MSHDAAIASLFAEGKSYAEIGKALGLTKGQVAGRCHRMRLKRKPGERAKPQKKPKPRREPKRAMRLIALDARACRYPIGDTRGEILFCGATRLENSSYCRRHDVLCHQTKRGKAA